MAFQRSHLAGHLAQATPGSFLLALQFEAALLVVLSVVFQRADSLGLLANHTLVLLLLLLMCRNGPVRTENTMRRMRQLTESLFA